MEPIQKNLRQARKEKGWTLAEAQNRTGVKGVTLGSYERGYRLPPVDVLMQLAKVYGTTVAHLIGEAK